MNLNKSSYKSKLIIPQPLNKMLYFRRIIAHIIDIMISLGITAIIPELSRTILFISYGYLGLILNTFIVLVIYSTLMEGAFGFTFGKFLLGLRVISIDDDPMSFTKSFGRNMFRFFDALLLYIPVFLWWQRIGDMTVSTMVVSKYQKMDIKVFHVTKEIFLSVEMQRNNIAQELSMKNVKFTEMKMKIQELMDLEWFLSHAIISDAMDQEGILEFEELRRKYNLNFPNF
jgi:uncharacterized RDD family membrane protein YckC